MIVTFHVEYRSILDHIDLSCRIYTKIALINQYTYKQYHSPVPHGGYPPILKSVHTIPKNLEENPAKISFPNVYTDKAKKSGW